MFDWNNLSCPLCGVGRMKKEPFGDYVVVDAKAFELKNHSDHSKRVDMYVCDQCKNTLLKKK